MRLEKVQVEEGQVEEGQVEKARPVDWARDLPEPKTREPRIARMQRMSQGIKNRVGFAEGGQQSPCQDFPTPTWKRLGDTGGPLRPGHRLR